MDKDWVGGKGKWTGGMWLLEFIFDDSVKPNEGGQRPADTKMILESLSYDCKKLVVRRAPWVASQKQRLNVGIRPQSGSISHQIDLR